jgi:hypothetical protein
LGDKERDIIRSVVMQAAADSKLEAMVYRFPSSLCTDIGRAINRPGQTSQRLFRGKPRNCTTFSPRSPDLVATV